MSLHAISYEEDVTPQERRLPTFEGQPVLEVRAKMTSVNDLDLGSDDPLRIDQTLRMIVSARVVRVDHVVDEKSGNLVRQHVLKVVDASPIGWDEAADLVFKNR